MSQHLDSARTTTRMVQDQCQNTQGIATLVTPLKRADGPVS
jgi:hypothetical protein